jgi:hypothetical protein
MDPSIVTGIVLQSYAASSVSVVLKPASVSAQVTVTAEGALLETQSASRAFNITNQTVKELPVINGNPVLLGNYIPGVRIRNLGIYTEPWTVTSQYMINGGLMYLNEFQIDGAPNDAEFANNTYAYTPPQFATKEFSVSSNNYDAEYGHTSGGVVNLSTLSGTDQYHGMGWGNFRRTGWDANSFQNKYENSVNGTTYGTPFNTETQLGFQVGGPIAIPHLVAQSTKYKPYFFFAFDHYTELLPRSLLLSYPTAKMRTGDFSELLNQPGYPSITINDPDSVHQNAQGTWVRDPFPGNVIPAGRLNPVAVQVAKLFPAVGNTPKRVLAGLPVSLVQQRCSRCGLCWQPREWVRHELQRQLPIAPVPADLLAGLWRPERSVGQLLGCDGQSVQGRTSLYRNPLLHQYNEPGVGHEPAASRVPGRDRLRHERWPHLVQRTPGRL